MLSEERYDTLSPHVHVARAGVCLAVHLLLFRCNLGLGRVGVGREDTQLLKHAMGGKGGTSAEAGLSEGNVYGFYG